MAQEVRRQVVQDPLAQRVQGQTPDRSIPLSGVRNPGQSAGDAYAQNAMGGLTALTGVRKAVADILLEKQDEWRVQGKMDFMTGVSEAEMLRTGNKYTQQGYEALNSVDQASSWYTNELLAIDETTREMSPEAYKGYLMQKRKEALSNLPNDPDIKKVYVAAFEEYGPRLAAAHAEAHNGFNRTKNINALSGAVYSSAGSNEDASRVMPGGPLRVSPGVVSPAIQTSAEDRDIGIRTMLGEAGGEGEEGMAAVGHVLKNRAIDGGYGGNTIGSVAKAPKQFSAWNSGPGGIPAIRSWSPNSKAYQRAAKVYDAVMSGHHADPTGGATHYYSPKGMELLVRQGAQKNLVPRWWNKMAAQGSVTIGNHKFAGKARNLGQYGSMVAALDPPDNGWADEADYFGEVPTKVDRSSMHGFEHERDTSLPRQQAAIPLQHTPGNSQIRQLFDASNMRPEDKAQAAADAMIRALEDGSDQVYNDLGGEGYLRDLGAKPELINSVQSAREKQVKTRQDKFDVDAERKTEDLRSAVKSGKFKTQEDLLEAVDGLQSELGQDEAWAHSLAKETLTEWNKVTEDDKALNPDLAKELAGIQRLMVEEPNYTADEASAAVQALGEKYDVDGKTVQGWIKDMWQRDATRKDKRIAEMKTEFDKQKKEQVVIGQVQSALKGSSGLASVKGTVRVLDDNGNEREVDAQTYGVKLLKDQEIANARSMIQNGEMQAERADSIVNKIVYEKLAKQGVIDKDHAAEITGALKGNFTDKSGKVNDDAVRAFDFWLQMKKNPNVGGQYMSRMITDPDVRVLLNTAEQMYSGRMDIADALRRAHQRISDGPLPEIRGRLNERFQAQIGAGVTDALDELTSTPFADYMLNGAVFSLQDRDRVDVNRDKYREDIINRANGYFIQNPAVDPEVHIRMAVEDFTNDAVVVDGNVLLGSTAQGTRLDQVMGVEDFGKHAPQMIINSYLEEYGPDLFPGLLTGPGSEGRTPGLANLWTTKTPYHVEYNPTMQTLQVQLWKDDTRKELIGPAMTLDAKEIASAWKASQREPSGAMNIYRKWREGLITEDTGEELLPFSSPVM